MSPPKSPQIKIPRKIVNGVLLLDKSLGQSSNQALQKVKWLLKAKKAGHTGNLDPLATGVLPLCFGEATKFASYGLEADKTYITTLELGATSSTGDAEGEITATFPIPQLNLTLIQATLSRFLGAQEQIPPMYSALKVQGKKLYELARAGQSVARAARPITIYALNLVSWTQTSIELEVRCSKGTYIRVLGEDIATALGSGGFLSSLRRTQVGNCHLSQTQKLEDLLTNYEQQGEAAITQHLLPIDYLVQHLPIIQLNYDQANSALHGQTIKLTNTEKSLDTNLNIGENVRLYQPEHKFIGLAQVLELEASTASTAPSSLKLQPIKMLANI